MIDTPYSPPEDGVEPDRVIDLSDALAPDPMQATEVHVEDDGSVTVTLGPAAPKTDPASLGHGDNLADALAESELGRIAEDLLEGIARDETSRAEWLQIRAEGIKLLGLALEKPGAEGASGMEGMSTVRDPLLLEAVIRHQANASAELLPADGIVKIRDDGQVQADDALATALERGMNHYLTVTATEYRSETETMLFWSGFGGLGLKKVYPCPLRQRPVSESVDAADLIVSNAATDIQNAPRVTHRILMDPITLKRMQIAEAYRDVPLGDPGMGSEANAVEMEKAAIEGVTLNDDRPEDRERVIFECYCFLDLAGFEHEQDGAVTGLPLPYKVTIDEASRQVLEIRKNWVEQDGDALPRRRQTFVPFTFVPGMGFYGIGLVHILGNTTAALTGLSRILIDAGMFANFPGGLIREDAVRQDKMSFRPAPGEFLKVKTAGAPINDAVMSLPYKPPDATTMSLAASLATRGQRIGGTAELQVGEGRQDAPVGTTLALIEAANKPMDAVHKRYCAAQAVEVGLMLDLFREMPEAFFRGNPRAEIPDEAALLQALDDYDLVPVADPNTSSHLQRIQKIQALRQAAKDLGPMANLYFDVGEINKATVEMLQLPNGGRFLNPNPPPVGWMPPPAGKGAPGGEKPPDPQAGAADMIRAQAAAKDAATRAGKAAADAQFDQATLALKAKETQVGLGTSPVDLMDAQTRRMQAETARQGLVADGRNHMIDAQQQAADRQSENHIAALDFLKEAAVHGNEMADSAADRQHDAMQAGLDRDAQGSGS